MEQHLPKIEPAVKLPNPSNPTLARSKSHAYYQAVHDLKEVLLQITTVSNRIKLLTCKESQLRHPISEYFEQRAQKIRDQASEQNKKSQEQLRRVQDQQQQILSKRQLRNEESKRENSRLRDQARRMISEQKYRSHDQVRQRSLENKRAIERIRMQALSHKKEQHQKVKEFEKRSRSHIRELSFSRQNGILQSKEAETNQILEVLRQKQKVLRAKEEECFLKECSIAQIMQQKRPRKKKVYPRRLFTEQGKERTVLGTDVTPTPHSTLSFVIIP